ncbi:MAG TPA: flagellar hook-length control protein FliK [Caulobacteraceae bacterium]|nr:flagellar hook-length control protein FliK [Caulobacteraceae bacterium]
MHSAAPTANASFSPLAGVDGAALGALATDAAKPGDRGAVDAFTQALAALLGVTTASQPLQATSASPGGSQQVQAFAPAPAWSPSAGDPSLAAAPIVVPTLPTLAADQALAAPESAPTAEGGRSAPPAAFASGATLAAYVQGAAPAGQASIAAGAGSLATDQAPQPIKTWLTAADQAAPGEAPASPAPITMAPLVPGTLAGPAREAAQGAASPALAALPKTLPALTASPQAQPVSIQTSAAFASGPSSPPDAASATLQTLSLATQLRGELVAPAAPAVDRSGAPALAPLAAGDARMALALQPGTAGAPKLQPQSAQSKGADKGDGQAAASPGPASHTDEAEAPIARASGSPTSGDDAQEQSSGDRPGEAGPATQAGAPPSGSAASTAQTAFAAMAQPPAAVVNVPAASATPIATQLATQVVKAAEGKAARFDIALEPQGLGRVDVKLQIDAQGQVSARFSFDNPHAAAEAQAQSSQLQQALEQVGFSVGQGGLSFDVGGQGASLAQQQSSPQPPAAVSTGEPAPLAEAALAARQPRPLSAASGVDITI